MSGWYYDKKAFFNTPSIQDGLDYSTEFRYRKEGARFIIDIGTGMDLGYNTLATGVVFFHRFYMFHSFKTFPRYVTACCCLFLAGKVEETPKKCKDIIKVAKNFLNAENFLAFGDDPKEEVMTLEKILLQTIKFDLKVQHPYSFLTKYAKCLKGDENRLQKMVQMAWTFINDSLCTTLSIQWEPEIIAIAVMYLAGKLSKFKIVSWHGRKIHHLTWWDMFVEDLQMDVLEDICHQVLDLYSPVKNPINLPSNNNIKIEPSEKVVESNNNSLGNDTNSANISKTVVVSKNEPIDVFIPSKAYIKTETLDSPKSTSFKMSRDPSLSIWSPEKKPYSPSFSMPNVSIPPPKLNVINNNSESPKSENLKTVDNDSHIQNSSNNSDNWLKNLSIHLRNQKHQFRRSSLDPRTLSNNYEKRSCSYFQKGTNLNNGNNCFRRNMFRDNMNRDFKRRAPGRCNNSRRFYSPSQA